MCFKVDQCFPVEFSAMIEPHMATELLKCDQFEEVEFKFYLVYNLNLDSCMWLLATVLYSAEVDLRK